MVPPFRDCKRASGLVEPVARTGYPSTGSPGPRWGPPIKGENTLTKPSETVVAGSKVPSALPANTRDVCVALGLVCACSCEQETLSSRIPAKKYNLKHGLYKYLDISYMLEKWSLKPPAV